MPCRGHDKSDCWQVCQLAALRLCWQLHGRLQSAIWQPEYDLRLGNLI